MGHTEVRYSPFPCFSVTPPINYGLLLKDFVENHFLSLITKFEQFGGNTHKVLYPLPIWARIITSTVKFVYNNTAYYGNKVVTRLWLGCNKIVITSRGCYNLVTTISSVVINELDYNQILIK